MTRFVSIILLLLCCLSPCLSTAPPPLSLHHKASRLVPVTYALRFYFMANISLLDFKYVLESEVHFKLEHEEIDELVLECTVSFIRLVKVVHVDSQRYLRTHIYRWDGYYIIRNMDLSSFQPGLYVVTAFIQGPIGGSHGRGIQHSLYMDSVTKEW